MMQITYGQEIFPPTLATYNNAETYHLFLNGGLTFGSTKEWLINIKKRVLDQIS